jgi:hypothetical protein
MEHDSFSNSGATFFEVLAFPLLYYIAKRMNKLNKMALVFNKLLRKHCEGIENFGHQLACVPLPECLPSRKILHANRKSICGVWNNKN